MPLDVLQWAVSLQPAMSLQSEAVSLQPGIQYNTGEVVTFKSDNPGHPNLAKIKYMV